MEYSKETRIEKEDMLIHYWQMPKNVFISLKPEFHDKICIKIQDKLDNYHKNCFYRILECPKWHAQRLFTGINRMTIAELETLRKFSEISEEEVELNIETIGSHENSTIIKNPKLPFQMKDLVYVASHLMFDGSYRDKKGCYFYAYEPSLVEYHKKRLSVLGNIPINLIVHENQLYLSYTIGYIAKRILEIETFKSTKTYLSKKLKKLCKASKEITDEIIKALIIDEGAVTDKIEIELANERLIEDIREVTQKYYDLNELSTRTRKINFKNNPKWTRVSSVWKIGFSANCFKELNKSIQPLPIHYKKDNLIALVARQSRGYNQKKMLETKKLIVKSLLDCPKTIDELAKQFLVKETTIRAHLKGHPTYTKSLVGQGIVNKIEEKILRRGGYAKVGVYGIIDMNKANEFLNK